MICPGPWTEDRPVFEATTQVVLKKRRNPLGVIISVLFHVALVAAIIGVAARKDDPEEKPVEVEVTFFTHTPAAAPPPPPPPPPPASSSKKRTNSEVKKPQVRPDEIVQPEDVEALPENEELAAADVVEGTDFGVEGGVEGGVIGGVVGGVIGGTGTTLGGGGVLDLAVDASSVTRVDKPDPAYPALAKKNGIEGEVVLEVIFGTDGRPEEITVKAGPKLFHKEAVKAVEKWRIDPVRSGNVVTKVRMTIRLRFSLYG